jgi:hypothetical protein
MAKDTDVNIAKGDSIKFDGGKTRVSLVDPDYILGTAKILTFGADKYEAGSWKKLPPAQIYRYKDALMRHILAYLDGENIDPDSGESHLYHASCNLMFLSWFQQQGVS